MNTKTVSDKAAVQDLFLYAVHNHKIWVNCSIHIIENLRKKFLSGSYDKDRAVIAWEVAATRAARLYVHEYYKSAVKYYTLFNATTRRECAQLLEEYFYENVSE